MSRLENAAKPLIIALIEQHRSLQSLSAEEAALLSKWAVKTAYLHSWAGPLGQPVQLSHLRELAGDGDVVAHGVGVFGMQSAYVQPSAYIQTGHWPQLAAAGTGEDKGTPAAAYKIGLQYRSLYLLVAFWPSPASVFVRVTNMHIRLIPQQKVDPEYAIQLTTGVGPIDRLAAFANWLGVWHSGGAV
jgi:hypothetical protein